MSNVLVAVLVLLYSFQSAFCNMFAKNYPGDKKYSSQVYSVIYGIVVSVATLVFAGFDFTPSAYTVILGLVNGAVLVTYNAMLIKASSTGPFSVTMIFNLTGGILIPMFWSILVDRMSISILQCAAIAVMLVSFVFLNVEEKKDWVKAPISAKFLLYAAILAVMNGAYGTLLNSQKNLTQESENAEMIIITFASSAVFALVLLALSAKGETVHSFRQTPKSALFALIASLSAAAAVNMLMYILGIINVAVLYAMDNGGVLIVSVLWSVIFFKEKLGRNKLIGLLLATIGIFALGILH